MTSLERSSLLDRVRASDGPWDLVIIGGGATGLGCAIDAAARGYRPLLLEQHDFAKGTSSRSTKLVHGGVRYLRQGNVGLVLEALRERGTLLKNAPHLVHDMPFIVPLYDWWEGPFYGIGLRVYDLLAGRAGFGRSKRLSVTETLQRLPTLESKGLNGGVKYFDGQFDDARLAINMAQTAIEQGAVALNYVQVTGLSHEDGVVNGVAACDVETGETFDVPAKVVVNATGVWADEVRRLDDPAASPMLTVSQGIHIVLERRFLPGNHAIMVPRTEDSRVLFAIPWHDRVVVGTTDTPVDSADLEPLPLEEEVEYVLRYAKRYLTGDPTREDVKSVFVGLRPLAGGPYQSGGSTAAISRDYVLHISDSGLVTITGGKWTTYRAMAEDTIDQAATLAGLPERASPTRSLRIHAAHQDAAAFGSLKDYGADAPALQEFMESDAAFAQPIAAGFDFVVGQVVWAARFEMARTVEDVLARRTRLLILDARVAIEAAPLVAATLASELNRDDEWVRAQIEEFRSLARGYLLH